MFKLVFFVPLNDAEKVKEAIFNTGAGSLGNYSHCSFEVKGTGQFKPLSGSHPTIGKLNETHRVEELRVEILCEKKDLKEAINALKKSHPYEEPAFEVYELFDIADF